MNRIAGIVISLLVTIAFVEPLRAADPKAPAAAGAIVERVVKLVDTTYTNSNEYVIVSPPEGGPTAKIVLTDDARKKFASLTILRGELVNISVKTGSLGVEMVTAITPFDGPKGLKSPKAYVFEAIGEQKVGPQTLASVKLSRFGQNRDVLVPNKAIPGGGKPGPDPALMERIKSFTKGDLVEVEVVPGAVKNTFTLVDIDAYRETQFGEFVKLETVKVGVKPVPAIVLNVDDAPRSFALPLASAPGAAQLTALTKRLKPGHFVRFTARTAPAAAPAGTPDALRELRIDGVIQPVRGDKDYELISTFVRINFNAGFGGFGNGYVYFYPGSHRPDDQVLDRGARRVVSSTSESTRLGILPEQMKQIRTALDTRPPTDDRATPAETNQWTTAFNAWTSARDEAERSRIEQQMLFAAQDVSARWRRDFEAKYTILKSVFTAAQLDEVRKMGQPGYAPALTNKTDNTNDPNDTKKGNGKGNNDDE